MKVCTAKHDRFGSWSFTKSVDSEYGTFIFGLFENSDRAPVAYQ